MELRQLRVFAAAAEQLSFTLAAHAFSMSQSAVSQHVASLEQELRQPLFKRLGRQLLLTDAGRRFYGNVRGALDLLDEAQQGLSGQSPLVGGTLRIASCTIPPDSFLPEVLAAFHQRYPTIRESLVVSDSVTATQTVAAGEADVAFVVKAPQDEHLRVESVACENLALVMAPDHPLASQAELPAEALRDQPFVMRETGSGTRECVERLLESAGIAPSSIQVVLETNSTEAVCGAVKEGLGIAFVALGAVRDEICQGRLVSKEVRNMRGSVHIYQVTDSRRIPTPVAKTFLTFLFGKLASGQRMGGDST